MPFRKFALHAHSRHSFIPHPSKINPYLVSLSFYRKTAKMQASIIVTGASGNMGAHAVKTLQKAGFHILGTAGGPESAAQLARQGVEAISLDLTDEAAVHEYARNLRQPASLKGAVLTAGGFAPGNLHDTDGTALRKMYSLNFETAFFMVHALLPIFEKNGGGQFILVGARPALKAEEGRNLAAYALSKTLVFKLSEFVNAYGKGKGIRSTVIVPSTIDTPANRKAMPDADFSKWVPLEAISGTIRFLFSEAGQHIREGVVKLYHEA